MKCSCGRHATFQICMQCNVPSLCGCVDTVTMGECAQCYFKKLETQHIMAPISPDPLTHLQINLIRLEEMCRGYAMLSRHVRRDQERAALAAHARFSSD